MISGKTLSVLVVDDETDTCQNLADILGDLGGYRVMTAHSGEAALELVRQQRFDVAIVDLMMPGMDGAALYKEIKRLRPGTVALLHTAYPGHPRADEAMAAGVWRLVPKPADVTQLLKLVEEFGAQPLVLVVDDDAELCANLWDLLRERGYRVCLANDAATAAERVRSNGFQLVLLDMRLPDGDGEQLVRLTRQADPDCRVLVITGYGAEMAEKLGQVLAEGASAVMHKPLDVPTLLATMRQLTVAHA